MLLAGPDVPEPIKQDIFLGDFPEMTDKGTFIINGTERVVVSQLIRSPGVYFEAPTDRATGRLLAMAKLIPDRGAWMEFETRKTDYIILKFNRKRTVPITVFLRALAAVDDGIKDGPLKTGTDEEMLSLFQDVDNNPDRLFIASTLKQEPNGTSPAASDHRRSGADRVLQARCARATRPRWTMPASSWKSSCSISAIMTWNGWVATS